MILWTLVIARRRLVLREPCFKENIFAQRVGVLNDSWQWIWMDSVRLLSDGEESKLSWGGEGHETHRHLCGRHLGQTREEG